MKVLKTVLPVGLMAILVWSFALSVACGDDDDDDRGDTGGGDVCEGHEPCEACKAVVELICGRTAECSDETTMDECLEEFYKEIDCYTAVDTGYELDECLVALEELDCKAILTEQIPYTCYGVIIVG